MISDPPFEPPTGPPSAPPRSAPVAPMAAPGWYAVDAISQRYWDGYQWTGHIAPLSPGAPGGALAYGATQNDRIYSVIMHLGGLFATILVPLIMWAIKNRDSEYIDFHGKQAINQQLSMIIYFVVSLVLSPILIGGVTFIVAIVLNFVFGIIAAVKASQGERYKVPVAIQFLK